MNQRDLSIEITNALIASAAFETVELRGSLNGGKIDSFSDIDIEVSNNQRAATDNVHVAIEVLRERKKILLIDWATSLLPDQSIASIYLSGYSVFWNVDISCRANQHVKAPENAIIQEKNGHILKLWILNAKYVLRSNTEKCTLDGLFRRLFPEENLSGTQQAKLIRIWRSIDREAIDSELVDQCEDLIEEHGWNECFDNQASEATAY
ncbi:MAG: hypothetical protein AB3N64_08555 [Puniceicoccaceae bacterium]